jgi:hypothetical protein
MPVPHEEGFDGPFRRHAGQGLRAGGRIAGVPADDRPPHPDVQSHTQRVDREPVAVVDRWRSAGVTFCRRAIPMRVDTLYAEPSG